MSNSIYEPLWQRLKAKKFIRVQIEVKPEESESDIKHKFKRIRKAISYRKQQDYTYYNSHPHARIEVTSSNVDTGEIIIELVYETPPFNLLEL